MTSFNTAQEEFWAGDFGDNYIERNKGEKCLASNLNLFSNALKSAHSFKNCIEFGANIGLNIQALKSLFPDLKFHAVEINAKAANILSTVIPKDNIFQNSILNFNSEEKWDLVVIKGVLIHINPNMLEKIYQILEKATNKYLLIGEYYSRNPENLVYRGFQNKLYKRDFAGEILTKYPNLELLDYGFIYHRDLNFPQDDITWFLLKKLN